MALGSILYLVLSVVMGLVDRFWRPPLWLTTLVFVPAMFTIFDDLEHWFARLGRRAAGGRPRPAGGKPATTVPTSDGPRREMAPAGAGPGRPG